MLKERFAGQAKNEMEMKAAVYTAWTQVDQNAVKRSIASWPKRLLLCLEKEGGCTHTTHTQETHNKAQPHHHMQHAGLFPNGVVSFMTPSALFEKSK